MMLHRCQSLLPIVFALPALACPWQAGDNYSLDKRSPGGEYSVKVKVRAKTSTGTRGYDDYAQVQFFRGQEVVHTYEWNNSDQYEPTFRESYPVIEWVADRVLRMGDDRSDQPFYDELIVSNKTDEQLRYVSVSYGRFELFWVFDLAPKSEVRLRASPAFKPNGSSNYFLGYGGMSRSGVKFEGPPMEKSRRKSPNDGPLTFRIDIAPKVLR